MGGHFGQAKGHQSHPRKGTKAKKKEGSNPKGGGGGGGTPTHFFFRLQKFPHKKKSKKAKQKQEQKSTKKRSQTLPKTSHGTETAQLTKLHFNAIMYMYAMRRDLTLA